MPRPATLIASSLSLLAMITAARADDGAALLSPTEFRASAIREVLADLREDDVRGVVAQWYAELQKGDEGYGYRLFTPMAIVDMCSCATHADGTPVKHAVSPLTFELGYRALKFSYEIYDLKADDNFARVEVWERGWFYASANEATYENAAATTFILERDDAGSWRIAAFTSRNSAVRPDHADDPMPDLRGEFHRRFPDRQ